MGNKIISKNNKSKKSKIEQKDEKGAEKQIEKISKEAEKKEELTKNQKLQKNDFIELAFTGKTATGEIFDTTDPAQAEKISPNFQPKPMIICLGQAMILPAIDEFLIGKNPGKYTLTLTAEQAFGKRNPKLIKTMPMSVFKKQETIPSPGMVFQFDNTLARISAVSGGRVIVDFNNPLAGKEVIYELDAKKKITNLDEKIKSLIQFFFRQDLKHEVKDKKLILTSPQGFEKFIEIFKPKFKEILDLELEVKIEKQENNSNKIEKIKAEKQKTSVEQGKESREDKELTK